MVLLIKNSLTYLYTNKLIIQIIFINKVKIFQVILYYYINIIRKINSHYFSELIRLILGVTFLLAAFSKILDPKTFIETVQKFIFIKNIIADILAYIILIIEFFVGISLIINFQIKFVSLIASSILFIFIAAIIPQLLIGNEFDCNCFGSIIQSKINYYLLLRDILLFILSIILYIKKSK